MTVKEREYKGGKERRKGCTAGGTMGEAAPLVAP